MPRTGAIFIGACIATVAASASLLLYIHAGFGAGGAVAAGLSLAVLMAVMHGNAQGRRERHQMRLELDHLYQVTDTLTGELDDVRRDLAEFTTMGGDLEILSRNIEARAVKAMEARVARQVEESRQSLVAEVRLIETLVKQLAEEVAAPRRRPAAMAAPAQAAPAPPMVAPPAPIAMAPAHDAGPALGDPAPGTPPGHLDDAAMLEMVRASIEENRVDIFFQPLVTLPQRKVRYYEALTRLRADDGDLIMPADYLRVAEPAGIMPLIDNLLLFRTVQVVRRLTARNRAVGIFCNISTHSLVDPDFFPQFMDFLEHNRALADSIFFEFGQATVNGAGPIEVESLAALHEQGFRFSMDKVTSLDFNAERLREQGFRFVKVEAERLLGVEGRAGAHIHPADLSKLLARHGIELIAEKIESEAAVVNLLDFDVGLAQGFLFAEPRPVRGDFGQDLPEIRQARRAG